MGDTDLKVISATENSIKCQKTKFWKEKSVEKRGNTWRLTIQFKHDFLSYLAVQKIDTYICKTMFTCWVALFCNGFTLGPMAQATLVYTWETKISKNFPVCYVVNKTWFHQHDMAMWRKA